MYTIHVAVEIGSPIARLRKFRCRDSYFYILGAESLLTPFGNNSTPQHSHAYHSLLLTMILYMLRYIFDIYS